MIAQHSFTGVDGRCIYCGAAPTPAGRTEERSCVGRGNGNGGSLRPEPARRTAAIDDYVVIQARVAELQKPPVPVAVENDLTYC